MNDCELKDYNALTHIPLQGIYAILVGSFQFQMQDLIHMRLCDQCTLHSLDMHQASSDISAKYNVYNPIIEALQEVKTR
jgi:hypothetical protein